MLILTRVNISKLYLSIYLYTKQLHKLNTYILFANLQVLKNVD